MALHDQWYKNAIIYSLDVETYADSNGDGVGDFTGLTRRLDYLSGLGVTCLWLMPFYPTPNRDDGYDITDYESIDPRLGTMADFTEFMLEARERGMHVLIDLVPNHTSNEHRWFQEARRDPASPYRDFYVWRDDDPGDTSGHAVFPGQQKGIWTYDEEAGAYYLHHFYDFQPELNFANPRVREEFRKIMGMWLQLGVQGFRVDAAPFLQSDHGLSPGDVHDYLQELKQFAVTRTGNAVLLGEADVGLSTLSDYFGGGNQLQAIFNFHLNRYLMLALAEESGDPLKLAIEEMPTIPGSGHWLNFLRLHDELSLARMTSTQRQRVYDAFGPEPRMQVYDRGIRRRLAPMLGGEMAKIRLAYSALFSLPGSPAIFYGEELGMGELLDLPERLSVRTPMQWTGGPSAGFSTAKPRDLVRPVVDDGDFSYERVNVSVQRADQTSLLNWMGQLIRTRRECGELGVGKWRLLDGKNPAVLAVLYEVDDSAVLIINNFSRKRVTVPLTVPGHDMPATELFSDRRYPAFDQGDSLSIGPLGYRWMRIRGIY